MTTIDTRDLYKRKCELEELRDAVQNATVEVDSIETELANASDNDDRDEIVERLDEAKEVLDSAEANYGTDEQAELAELEELESNMDARQFRDGETLILERDFEDYARQYADDIGAIPDDAGWPCSCIDWERAARELAMDYSSVTYQGDDYYVRA